MPTFLKFSLIGIASIILLVAVGVAGIFLFVDPNDFKADITRAVRDATGRELTIAGDISLSIYPWLGLSLGKTELSNADGFGDTPFARIENVDIKVKLLPLLQQHLEMQKIRLLGLQANLAKDQTGRSNWEDLVAKKATEEKKPVTPEAPAKPVARKSEASILAALAVDGLEIKDARLDWNDRQSGQHIVVEKMNLQTGPLALPAPVDMSLSLDMHMDQPEIKSHVDFTGQVAADLASQQYRADKLNLKVSAKGPGLPVSPLDARFQANIEANLEKQTARVQDVTLNALGATLSGQINITGLDKTPEASGRMTLAEISPREIASKLGIQLPETRDKSALTKTRAEIEFSGNPGEVSLKKLSMTLDETELSGTASVKNFSSPVIRFNLKANDIDVDRYLPPAPEKPNKEKALPAPGPNSAASPATQLPLQQLRSLNINGNINLDKLKVIGAQMTAMQLGISGKSGQIQLHPVEASIYGGHNEGNIKLDVRTDTPKISVDQKLTDVNIGPLLKDITGKEYVSGRANINAQLFTAGTSLETIKQSLNGKANFSFHDGKVYGVNIGQMIREAYAKLKKKPAPTKTENATDFAEMTGSVTVADGIVRNDDLTAKSPLLRINGEGKVNLPREKINYLVNAAIVESNEGQTGKELEELKSLIIPVKVTGKLTDPRFSLDLAPVLQKRAKEVVDKKIESEKKKIKKQLEKDLKKKLEEDLKKKLGL